MTGRLKLRARDLDDLAVISAMIQDALVPIADMDFLTEEKRFVLALNRFRWDQLEEPSRTHALLTVQHVTRVQTKDVDRRRPDRIQDLLSLTFDGSALLATFAGGGTLRLEAEALDCLLEDVGEPWPAQATPAHPDET